MYCIKCDNIFSDRLDLNYTCRCHVGHAICFECSKDIRYKDARQLFGYSHYLDVKQYHEDDLLEWNAEVDLIKQKNSEFKDIYIDPNTDEKGYLNIEEIFKTYKGEEHRNLSTSKKYNWLYKPEEVCNRWYKASEINRTHNVIYQIRTPIDTEFTLISNGLEVLKVKLKANVPFKLCMPMMSLPYTRLETQFVPKVDEFEFTGIDIWAGFGASDPLHKYMMRRDLLIPSLNLLIHQGVLIPLNKKPLIKKWLNWIPSKKLTGLIGVITTAVFFMKYQHKLSIFSSLTNKCEKKNRY